VRTKFKPDDRVRIVVPKFVDRVGYPKQVKDYIPQVKGKVDALIVSLGVGLPHNHRMRHKLEAEAAYLLAQKDGFGGRERSVHWIEAAHLQGKECRISSIRTAVTGTYYPPSGGNGMYSDDYEPGGLSGEKRWRLATVTICRSELKGFMTAIDFSYAEIPIEHLEKAQ